MYLALSSTIAFAECSVLNQRGGHRTSTDRFLRLDDDAAGRPVGIGFQLLHVGDKQDHVEEIIESELLLGRHVAGNGVTTVGVR